MKKFLLIVILFGSIFYTVIPDSNLKKNTSTDNKPVKVGVYGDQGTSSVCVIETMAALMIDPGIEVDIIFGSDIADGVLNSLDVIIFPGGSGRKEAMSMGVLGR